MANGRLIPGRILEDRMNWYAKSRWWSVNQLDYGIGEPGKVK